MGAVVGSMGAVEGSMGASIGSMVGSVVGLMGAVVGSMGSSRERIIGLMVAIVGSCGLASWRGKAAPPLEHACWGRWTLVVVPGDAAKGMSRRTPLELRWTPLELVECEGWGLAAMGATAMGATALGQLAVVSALDGA